MYIVALVMPTVLNLIPNFILIKQLEINNSLIGIIAPGFFGNAFGVFFLRQIFLGLNKELEEAAKLDGASIIRIFFSIVLPAFIIFLRFYFSGLEILLRRFALPIFL